MLLKDISDKVGYTKEEQDICAALREKPLTVTQLAAYTKKKYGKSLCAECATEKGRANGKNEADA